MVKHSETAPILGSRASEATATASNGQIQNTETPTYYYVEDYYHDEDGYSIYSENTIKRHELYKKLGIAAAVLISVPLCFFFFVYLPSLVPEGTDLPTLVKVSPAGSFLHPLVPMDNAPDYGKPKKGGKIKSSDFNDESITGKLPSFQHYKFLDKKSKLFKDFFRDSESVSPDEQASKKRYILIGDIHGSLSQLHKLLNKVGFDRSHEQNDHVIMLGDFLNKGPDSIGVLDYAIENKLDCVLGNHEIEILKRYVQLHGLPPMVIKPTKDDNDDDDEDIVENSIVIKPNESYDFDEMMRIAKKLYPVHIDYLSKCSIIKTIGPVPHFKDKAQNRPYEYPAEGVAVHGGLQWHIQNITDQDPNTVLTIRALLAPDFKIPCDDRHVENSESWSKHWTLHQRKLFKEKLNGLESGKKGSSSSLTTIGTKVFYGHDAGRGLTYREYSTGIDTGCVYGDELTAELIWSEVENDKIVYKRTSTHVDCS